MGSYSLKGYGAMLSDAARCQAYRAALEKEVRPGSVVLDIGTGTGIHAMIACRLGARRVYAIEPSDVIGLAREIAAENGLSERIEFIQDRSTRIELPEGVDLIVSDLRGILPLFAGHIPAIIDARDRHLANGGTLVPREDRIWVAPVEAEDAFDGIAGPWGDESLELDMSAAQRMATQTIHRHRVLPGQLAAQPRLWVTLDYATVDDPNVTATCSYEVDREAIVHGFAAWFDSTLTGGVELSTAPADDDPIYGRAFFPLSRPVRLEPRDRLEVEISARLVASEYIWRWKTEIHPASGSASQATTIEQSTFYGSPLAKGTLSLAAADSTPSLSTDGRIDAEVLGLLNGQTPLQEVAKQLARSFPDRFRDHGEAFDHVASLVRRYGE